MVRKRTKKRCFVAPVTDHKLKIIQCAAGSVSTLSRISIPESLAAHHISVKVNESVKGLTIHHFLNCRKT